MSGATYICGVQDFCVKHNIKLHGYPCYDCQEEWRNTNPATYTAIAKFAAGKSSLASIQNARKLTPEIDWSRNNAILLGSDRSPSSCRAILLTWMDHRGRKSSEKKCREP
jgi:hypothetical protein